MLSKLEIINKNINNIYQKNELMILFMKKNKNYVLVKDNYVTYKIYIRQLKCQCRVILCDHILFALSKYGLSSLSICYMNVINDFPYALKQNNINQYIENIIDDYFSNHECGICLEELSNKKHKYHLYQCKTCHNYVHSLCMEKWISFNKKKNEVYHGCIYCSSKILDNFDEHFKDQDDCQMMQIDFEIDEKNN